MLSTITLMWTNFFIKRIGVEIYAKNCEKSSFYHLHSDIGTGNAGDFIRRWSGGLPQHTLDKLKLQDYFILSFLEYLGRHFLIIMTENMSSLQKNMKREEEITLGLFDKVHAGISSQNWLRTADCWHLQRCLVPTTVGEMPSL